MSAPSDCLFQIERDMARPLSTVDDVHHDSDPDDDLDDPRYEQHEKIPISHTKLDPLVTRWIIHIAI